MAERHDRRLDQAERRVDRVGLPRPVPPADDRAALEGDLLAFVRAAWPILEPARPFVENWHHALIAEYLTAVFQREVLRLIVNVPPRHTKSRLAAVLWPCWCWAQDPARAWIFGSYASGLAVRHSLDRRAVLASEWYRARWGDRVAFAPDQNLKAEYENTARGTMVATSVGGTAFGLGADVIVVDDPHNPEQALSEAERETGLRWFDHQLATRLNDPATGAIVVIMQRLHQQDLTGHLLEQGDWTHVVVPAEAEDAERRVFPVSGTVHERAPGALLWPARFTAEVLERQKRRIGSWGFAAQFQQRPAPLGGAIFQTSWWRFYDEPPAVFDDQVASWDCAFKDTTGADFVVGQVWGKRGADCYLLDQVRGRWDFPRTLQMIRALAAKWPQASAKLVEDKANGPAVIATLQHEIPGLIAVTPEGGKVVRAQAVTPMIEAGNVYLPRPERAPWVGDVLAECAAFPTGAHDDQVDSLTQALRRLVSGGTDWGTIMRHYDRHMVPRHGPACTVCHPRGDGSAGRAAAIAQDPGFMRATEIPLWPPPPPTFCPRCRCRTIEATAPGAWRCRNCGGTADDGRPPAASAPALEVGAAQGLRLPGDLPAPAVCPACGSARWTGEAPNITDTTVWWRCGACGHQGLFAIMRPALESRSSHLPPLFPAPPEAPPARPMVGSCSRCGAPMFAPPPGERARCDACGLEP